MFGSLGFPEIMFIFVIALIFFGPRKLPEIGKSLGQTLGQFKRASEDFKRSWEDEVEIEKRRVMEPPRRAETTKTAPEPLQTVARGSEPPASHDEKDVEQPA